MTLHIWESSDFIEIKNIRQRNILRIDLFNEIAVSGDDILNLELEAVAGLHHGVPVEGPFHLLDLLDQVLGFVVRLCLELWLSDAPCK